MTPVLILRLLVYQMINCCAKCCGDCLSVALPCACAAETGGEFVYTQEGLLKEKFLDECMALCSDPKRKHFYHCQIPLQNNLKNKSRKIKPCNSHLTRKFIKECWNKCGCNKACGNRIVQGGIQIAMQVRAISSSTVLKFYCLGLYANFKLTSEACSVRKHLLLLLLFFPWHFFCGK